MASDLTIVIKGNSAQAVSAIKSVNTQMGLAGKKMTGMKSVMTNFKANWLGISAAVFAGVGIVKSALATYGDFEETIKNVAAVSGESEKALGKLARAAGKATVFSAKQAGDSLYFLASAGYKAKDMSEILIPTLNLAAAAQMGIAEATDIVINNLKVFKREGLSATEMTDIMAQTVRSSNTNMNQLGEALKIAGNEAALNGIKFSDTAAIIAALANQGQKGSEAGTKMRMVFARLGADMPSVTKTLEKYFDNTKEITKLLPTPIKLFEKLRKANITNADATKIFGVRNKALFGIIRDGMPDLKKMQKAIENSGGAADEMAKKQLKALNNQLKLVDSAFKELVISTTEKFVPMIVGIVKAVRGFINLLSSIPSSVKVAVVAIVASLAVLSIAVKLLGKSIMTAFPWMAIASAAVAAILVIVTHWKEISGFFKDLWRNIIYFCEDAFISISVKTEKVIDTIVYTFKSMWLKLKLIISIYVKIYTTIIYTMLKPFKWLAEKVIDLFKWLAKKAIDIFNKIKTKIIDIFGKIKTKVINIFGKIKDGIVFAIDKMIEYWTKFKNFSIKIFNIVFDFIKNVCDKIALVWNFLTGKMKYYFNIMWVKIKEITATTVDKLVEIITFLIQPFTKVIDKVIKLFNKLRGTNIKTLGEMVDDTKDAIEKKIAEYKKEKDVLDKNREAEKSAYRKKLEIKAENDETYKDGKIESDNEIKKNEDLNTEDTKNKKKAALEETCEDTKTLKDCISEVTKEILTRTNEYLKLATQGWNIMFGAIAKMSQTAEEKYKTNRDNELKAFDTQQEDELKVLKKRYEDGELKLDEYNVARGLIISRYNAHRVGAEDDADKKIAKEKEKQAKLAKAQAIMNVIVNTASGIMMAYASLSPVVAGIYTGIISALGIAQISVIAAEPIPKYAAGGDFTVPEGYEDDSYPMMVESGEHVSVTPADETESTGNIIIENLVIQAMQIEDIADKVIDQLYDIADRTGRTLMVKV